MQESTDKTPTELGRTETETQDPGRSLADFLRDRRYAKFIRFVFAALGSIPWLGGFIAAGAALHAEKEQGRVNELSRRWVEEHQQKIYELNETLAQMMSRLEQLGPQVEEDLKMKAILVWSSMDLEFGTKPGRALPVTAFVKR